MNILCVENNPDFRSCVQQGLTKQGFKVTVSSDAPSMFANLEGRSFDAIVLQVMAPGNEGLAALRKLRQQDHEVPVVLVTAHSELNERIEGFDAGADDYLTKPFFIEELGARLTALIRRNRAAGGEVLEHDGMTLEVLTREVEADGIRVDLTSREFTLLHYLMRHPDRAFTRAEISSHVWNTSYDSGTNMVDVGVARLRKKIDDGKGASRIETVRGVGYRLRPAAVPAIT